MTKLKKITVLALALLLIANIGLFALAAPDLTQKGSISLTLLDKETGAPVEGKKFSLYLVAKAHTKGESIAYTYTAEFINNGISIDDRSADNLALHLTYFARSNALPCTEQITDKNGKVAFTDLETGLYLVVPEDIKSNPFLVSIPEELGGEWEFHIDATPKVEFDNETEDGEDISVEKRWKGDSHPGSVTVVLLRNGFEYDEEILSDANGWKLTWEKLSKKYAWAVVEKGVPYGFTVSYEATDTKTIITNELNTESETTSPDSTTNPDSSTSPDGTTSPDDTTSPDGTTLPDGTTSPDESTTLPEESTTVPVGTTTSDSSTTKPQSSKEPTTKKETTTKEQLADTGQLNWPVPVLAGLGLLLFSVGWAMMNLKKEQEGYETN